LALRPRKGHLAITDRYPGVARHQIIDIGYIQNAQGDAEESVAFNVQPRPSGQLLIGSSRQYGAIHSGIDPHMMRQVFERAFHFLPALRDCNILRAWTGFRACTPDKQPLIGEYRENVFVATGHEGLGITTSLGTAAVLAALLLNRQPPVPAAPYHPRRFDG